MEWLNWIAMAIGYLVLIAGAIPAVALAVYLAWQYPADRAYKRMHPDTRRGCVIVLRRWKRIRAGRDGGEGT